MTNAALHLHPNAHDALGPLLNGRISAGASFLRGFLQHAEVDRFYFWCEREHIDAMRRVVRRDGEPRRPIAWVPSSERAHLAKAGVLQTAGPYIAEEAWSRRAVGQGAYSICGLTHTVSTARAMDLLTQMLIAPVESHDALICTSSAVRTAVEAHLAGVRDWLAQEYGGPRRRPEAQLATIPLGIQTEDFAPKPGQREAWRERLGIPEQAIVALFVGRLSRREKMNPALMAIALERAARASGAMIHWINCGLVENAEDQPAWESAYGLCPSVTCHTVDGLPPEVRTSIWSAADFFISFSDNIQETFGLTPVEAMAAGLPCVVTDWDGYRDTVRHGEDGFRIPTVAPPPGNGVDLAYWFANGWLGYVDYVGAAAQYTAIDYAAATEAVVALVTNADLRRRLGDNARARARAVFDWSAVIPQYQELWGDLNALRMAKAPAQEPLENPFRPDPFRVYAAYPTRQIDLSWRVSAAPDLDVEAALALLAGEVAAYSPFNRPTAEEQRALLKWLAGGRQATVEEAAAQVPPRRRPAVARGLLWFARYGVIELSPPD
jgi:glycosyltransferase involved in cell wall biosynthesis